MSQNNAKVKRANCRSLKNALAQLGCATKGELAHATGLSFATCSNLVNDMVQTQELLAKQDLLPGETGRPACSYRLNPTFALTLGLFAEQLAQQPRLHAVITDLTGCEVAQETVHCGHLTAQSILSLAKKCVALHPRISCIGISIQGVAASDGTILFCDAPLLKDENPKALLAQQLTLPVLCENDMNLIAYGMIQPPAQHISQSAAVLAQYTSVPAGAGLVINGEILRGSTNFAGEISYLPCKFFPQARRIAHQVISIVTVLNPARIALVGDALTEELLPQIEGEIQQFIPKEHRPVLERMEDPFTMAKKGMAALCLKQWNEYET